MFEKKVKEEKIHDLNLLLKFSAMRSHVASAIVTMLTCHTIAVSYKSHHEMNEQKNAAF